MACGAFPFAFRTQSFERSKKADPNDYISPNLIWKGEPRTYTYSDGGILQNQPLGMAKNLVVRTRTMSPGTSSLAGMTCQLESRRTRPRPGESRVLNNGVPKIEERRILAVSGFRPRNSDNRR